MEQIINRDYIGVVSENEDGLLEFSRIPIDRNPIEKNILKLFNDSRSSIFDMQSIFKEEYPDEKNIDYIYPNEYNVAWIDDTKYPVPYDNSTMNQYVSTPIFELENEFGDEGNKEIVKLICDKIGCQYNDLEAVFTNYLYKKIQLNNYLYYIYASDYTKKLSEIKQNENIKIYSTDTLGHSTFKYTINKDITIFVKTNFGYGSATYFVCNLKYKNVNILPYTAVVNYYYVNWTDFLECTRDYAPKRDNWTLLFDYVVRISNLIITDLEGFKREVLDDVKNMVDGLEKIYSTPETYLQKLINVKKEDFEISSCDVFRLVRIVSSVGWEQFKVYPEEKTLVFKVQKITGCLELLENLKQLKEFIPEIGRYRNRIKELNSLIAPEISKAISKLNVEIARMEKLLQTKNVEFDEMIKDDHKQYLKDNKNGNTNFDEYKAMMIHKFEINVFLKYCKNPNIKVSSEIENVYTKIQDLETKLDYRNKFLKSLEKGQGRIERFLKTN